MALRRSGFDPPRLHQPPLKLRLASQPEHQLRRLPAEARSAKEGRLNYVYVLQSVDNLINSTLGCAPTCSSAWPPTTQVNPRTRPNTSHGASSQRIISPIPQSPQPSSDT